MTRTGNAKAPLEASARYSVVELQSPTSDFERDVRLGLTAHEKRLSCRYLYDEAGSRLFQNICELEEYYVPRAEREILTTHAAEILALTPPHATIVELGSGDAAKTHVILDAFHRRDGRVRYMPIDIDPSVLEASAERMLPELDGLEVDAIAGEYGVALAHLDATASELEKLILFLGSNIGNFDRRDASRFLVQIRQAMGPRDRLLIGVDLRKDPSILVPAYDDPHGVTSEFNLNLLARINRELGGHFDLTGFTHRAFYEEEAGRMAMYLESLRDQIVAIDALGLSVQFRAGELIHTEYSYKYAPAEIDALAEKSGLRVLRRWFDSAGLFSSNLLAR